MIITTRKQFDTFLKRFDAESLIVYDTEANGLDWTRHSITGISIYLPDDDRSYYLPFRHGIGEFSAPFEGYQFKHMTWAKNDKKVMFTDYWYRKLGLNYNNLPIDWLKELVNHWTDDKTYIAHNAKFDVHMLHNEGFPVPSNNLDTMLMLHTLQEGLTTTHNRPNVRITMPDGEIKNGFTFALKPVCEWLGIPEARQGEESLDVAIHTLHDAMVQYIIDNHHLYIDDPDDTLDNIRTKKGILTDTRISKINKYISLDSKANMWALSPDDVAPYAELDVILTWKLYNILKVSLEAWGNTQLASDWSNVVTHWVWQLERNGIHIDVDYAVKMKASLLEQIAQIEALFPINIASNPQKVKYLNEQLSQDWSNRVPDWFKGDTEYYPEHETLTKVNKQALSPYTGHPAVQLIHLHASLNKSVGTYLDNFIQSAGRTGYIHGSYKGHGTVSGRLASGSGSIEGSTDSMASINLQNIPSRGYKIKNVFTVPAPYITYDPNLGAKLKANHTIATDEDKAMYAKKADWILFELDYSSLESRLCAYVAEVQLGFGNYEQTNLLEADADIHSFTADKLDVHGMMFNNKPLLQLANEHNYTVDGDDKALEKYTYKKLIRQMGKTANFALLYGGSGFTLAGMAGLDMKPVYDKPHALALEYPDNVIYTKGKATFVVVGKDADKYPLYEALAERWHNIFPAYKQANFYFMTQARTMRERPDGKNGYFYVTQPISGRHRHFNLYPNERQWVASLKRAINPFMKVTKDAMNNVVQGLGGYLTAKSGYDFLVEYGNDCGLMMIASTHDSITGYVRSDKLSLLKELDRHMTKWDIRPALTTGLEVSYDTWQNLKEVKMEEFVK